MIIFDKVHLKLLFVLERLKSAYGPDAPICRWRLYTYGCELGDMWWQLFKEILNFPLYTRDVVLGDGFPIVNLIWMGLNCWPGHGLYTQCSLNVDLSNCWIGKRQEGGFRRKCPHRSTIIIVISLSALLGRNSVNPFPSFLSNCHCNYSECHWKVMAQFNDYNASILSVQFGWIWEGNFNSCFNVGMPNGNPLQLLINILCFETKQNKMQVQIFVITIICITKFGSRCR